MSPAAAQSRFSPLEARVIRLAASRFERGAGAPGRWLDRLAGRRTAMPLADPRLEALRIEAIRARNGGAHKPNAVDPAFLAAGFTPGHAATIADFMAEHVRRSTMAVGRDRAAYAGGVGLALGSFAGFVALTVTCLI